MPDEESRRASTHHSFSQAPTVCIWSGEIPWGKKGFSCLSVHLILISLCTSGVSPHVLFSKMASPSCDLLMLLSRRIPAAFVTGCNTQQGQCWGSGLLWRFPQNSASFIFWCPIVCQDISPGRQEWLNCQSWMTAAAQTRIKPTIFRKSILFWAVGFQISGRIICDTFTLRHMLISGLQIWFSAFQTPKAFHFMDNLIYYICGGKAAPSLNLCFLMVVDLKGDLFPLNYIVSFIYLLNFCIGCCRIC